MSLIPTTLIGQFLLIFLVFLPAQQRGKRHTVEIHNHTDVRLERIYLSSTSAENWGDDRLGKGYLSPQHYQPIEVPTGDYDFKAITDDERKCTILEITITGTTKIEVADSSNNKGLKCRVGNDIE
jgi:hypothetical protein